MKDEKKTKAELIAELHTLRGRIEHAENEHSAFFERLPLGYLALDENGRICDVNSKWCEITGRTKRMMIGKQLGDFINPEERSKFEKFIGGFNKKNAANGITFELERADSSRIDVNLDGQYYINTNGAKRIHCVLKDITEIINPLTVQQNKEKRLLKAMRIAHIGDWQWDLATDTVWHSVEAKLILGTSETLKPNGHSHSLFHPEDRERYNRIAQTAIENGDPIQIDYRITRPDGEVRWIHDESYAEMDDSGKPVRYIGTMQDVTERKLLELEKVESEEKYRLVTEHIPVVVYSSIPDKNSTTTFISGRAKEITGYSSDEFLSDPGVFHGLVHPEDREYVKHAVQECKNKRQPLDIEYRIITKNGETKHIHDRSTLGFDENGEVVRTDGFMDDITLRKNLAGQTMFQANLLSAVRQVVVAFDTKGTITYWNRAAEKLSGWTASEAIDVNIIEKFAPKDMHDMAVGILKKTLAGDGWSGEFTVTAKDKRQISLLISASPIFDVKGKISGAVGVATDITRQKKAEHRIRQDNETLSLINDLNHAANARNRTEEIIELLDKRVRKIFKVDSIHAYFLSDDKRYLLLKNLAHSDAAMRGVEQLIGMKIPTVKIHLTKKSEYAKILGHGAPQTTCDPAVIKRMMEECTKNKLLRKFIPAIGNILNIKNVMSIPLIVDGNVIGLLDTSRKDAFTQIDIDRFSLIAEQFGTIYSRIQSETNLSLFKTIAESAQLAIAIKDGEENFLYINPAHEKLFGRSLAEARKVGSEGYFPPESLSVYNKQIRPALRRGDDWEGVLDAVDAGGRRFPLWNRASGILDSKGNLLYGFGFMQDDSKRRQMEEMIRSERDRAERYLEIAGVLLIALDDTQAVTMINRKGCEILGRSRDEIIGKNWFDTFIPLERREEVKAVYDKTIRGEMKQVEYYENTIVRADGVLREIAWHNSVVKDSAGNVVEVLCSGEDITDRKMAEERLRFLGNVTEQATDSIICTDPGFKIIYVNKAATELFGYTAGELIGQTPDILNAEPAAMALQRQLYDKVSAGKTYTGVHLNKRKDGTTFINQFRVSVMRDGGGNINGYISAQRDITALVRAREALEQSEKLLKEAQRLGKIGGWEWDVERRTMTWTDETYRIHGINPSDLEPGASEHIDRSLQCYQSEDREKINTAFSNCEKYGAGYDIDSPFTGYDGQQKWVRTIGRAQKRDGKVVKVLGNIIDISESKRAELELEEASSRLAGIMAAMDDFVFVFDKDSRFVFCNAPRARSNLFLDPNEFLGKTHAEIMPQIVNRQFNKAFNAAKTGKTTEYEYSLAIKGNTLWYSSRLSPILIDGEFSGAVAVVRDISGQRRLQQIAADISEDERAKLRRELHDTVCQQLAGTGFLTDQLSEDLAGASDTIVEQIQEIGTQVRKALVQAQVIGHEMEILPDKPDALYTAMTDLASRVSILYGTHCRVTSKKPVLLENGKAGNQLLLIAQEAATNAAKHAEAGRIELSLTQRGGLIKLSVRDNGKGISLDEDNKEGMGIDIMRERALLIGAELDIRRHQTGGTLVECKWRNLATDAVVI